jgi:hypothetical protein
MWNFVAFVLAVFHVRLICVWLAGTAWMLDGGVNAAMGTVAVVRAEYAENPKSFSARSLYW